jgi:hypothetical protein
MVQKLLFSFTNIYAEILLHITGCSFCADWYVLVHFCQMLWPEKAPKIICAKADLLWPQKSW